MDGERSLKAETIIDIRSYFQPLIVQLLIASYLLLFEVG